jgi:hypothetical protein
MTRDKREDALVFRMSCSMYVGVGVGVDRLSSERKRGTNFAWLWTQGTGSW